jgi:amidophosphoribosyltransferase
MAANYSVEEICRYLSADSLHYLSEAGMVMATGLPKESFCMACYNGIYPVPFDAGVDKHIIERRNGRLPNLAESLAKEKAQIKLL